MGTIGEYVKRGGALPGSGSFNREAVQKEVNERKRKKRRKARPKVDPSPGPTTQLTNKQRAGVGLKEVMTEEEKAMGNKLAAGQKLKEPEGDRIFSQSNALAQRGITETKENDFFSIEGQKERLTNVGEVFKTLIPGNKDTIQANVKNDILKFGLEAAANNPLTTAALYVGIGGLAKGGIKLTKTALAARKEPIVTFGQGALNAKTARLSGGILTKAGFTAAASIFILKDAASTYPFSQFQINEALQSIGMARWQAIEAGRDDLVLGLAQLQDEVVNPTGWNWLARKIPWLNEQVTAVTQGKTMVATSKVIETIIKDQQIAVENGETPEQTGVRVNQQEQDNYTANTDYYNQERKKLLKWEEEAKDRDMKEDAAFRAGERAKVTEEERKFMKETAAFWAKERAKQRKKEEEDRIAIAKFWNDYRKMQQRMAEDTRPSNLKFGLL